MFLTLVDFYRCQKRFQDFLEEWKAEGTDELKYLPEARELVKPERNTLQVVNRVTDPDPAFFLSTITVLRTGSVWYSNSGGFC